MRNQDNEQADVEEICKKHNIGRYDLVTKIRLICDHLECNPHTALKELLKVDDLDKFLETIRSKNIDKELKRRLRGQSK